jgi:plasmid stabilization system protein ParE
MKYDVVWTPAARRQLAEIWLASEDQAEISRASHTIDQMLAMQGSAVGKPLREGLHRVMVRPLAAYFAVSDADARIEVGAVAVFR